MKALSINDIKDTKVRNAVIMAQESWSKHQKPFSKADVGKVKEYMLKLTREKTEK